MKTNTHLLIKRLTTLTTANNPKLLTNKSGTSNLIRSLSVVSNRDEPLPKNVDIAIFGGGVMGSSIAYWLKQRLPKQISCAVIERDPTYSKCSTTLSVGGIRQQFSVEENIQLSLFSSKFLQNIEKHLSVPGQTLPHSGLRLNGYLMLASDSGANRLIQNYKLQTELGAKIQLLSADKIQMKFPWVNTNEIALASYGYENEGWFDPWALLMAFKLKAQSLGVNYVNANVIGFNRKNSGQTDETGSQIQSSNEVIFKEADGAINSLTFGTGIVCCGAYSSIIAEYLGYGSDKTGVRSFALPIEPRKRYVYVFHCVDGPGPQTPLLFDTSQVYFRPEGNSGNYLCGRCPDPVFFVQNNVLPTKVTDLFSRTAKGDEPSVDDMEVDYTYFESSLWPFLAKRVKAFESIKVKNSWAGLYEYNCFDQNAIIGRDPYYSNIYWAAGFTGHGIQMAPAVGMALTELILDKKYKTIDLTRFGWQRIFNDLPLRELNVY